MSAFVELMLPDEKYVIRLVINEPERYLPDQGKVLPPAFAFSEDERIDEIPKLSVFDLERTEVPEAQEIHGRKDTLAFFLNVRRIRSVSPDRLYVIEDALPPSHPKVSYKGADGHCGIIGLKRLDNETRVITRDLRSKLADICERTPPKNR